MYYHNLLATCTKCYNRQERSGLHGNLRKRSILWSYAINKCYLRNYHIYIQSALRNALKILKLLVHRKWKSTALDRTFDPQYPC